MSQRVRRANESIKEALAEALFSMKDPRIGFVTITEVRTTPDLRQATVYYTVLPDDEASRAETAAGLRSAAPLLRREVGRRVRMKHLPDLEFAHDPVPEYGRRIERLLRDEENADDGDQ